MKIKTFLLSRTIKKISISKDRCGSFTGLTSIHCLLTICLLFFVFSIEATEAAEPSSQILSDWIEKQSRVKRWSADVLQIRKLKALVRPLETRGRVWVAPPDRFRWQLGDPASTIAVQTGEEMVIIYPRLKQMERYPDKDIIDPAWKQIMALLDVGFPRDSKSFYEKYEVSSITESNNIWRFELQPAALEGRKLLDRVRIEVTSDNLTLLATELVFSDGSTMRNQFSGHRVNHEIDESLFEVPSHEGYEVIYPLQKKGS